MLKGNESLHIKKLHRENLRRVALHVAPRRAGQPKRKSIIGMFLFPPGPRVRSFDVRSARLDPRGFVQNPFFCSTSLPRFSLPLSVVLTPKTHGKKKVGRRPEGDHGSDPVGPFLECCVHLFPRHAKEGLFRDYPRSGRHHRPAASLGGHSALAAGAPRHLRLVSANPCWYIL